MTGFSFEAKAVAASARRSARAEAGRNFIVAAEGGERWKEEEGNEKENENENENENGGGERGKRKGGLQRKGNREACEDVKLDNPKLCALEGAVARRETLRAAGKRVVLTNGVFDLLHTGHLFYLQQARARGDALFIALNADASVRALKGPTRPIQSEEQRAYALAALACVDGIFILGRHGWTRRSERCGRMFTRRRGITRWRNSTRANAGRCKTWARRLSSCHFSWASARRR